MSCYLCKEDVETRNIDLYVIGSEGLNICHDCEMILVEVARQISSIATKAKARVYLKMRQEGRL